MAGKRVTWMRLGNRLVNEPLMLGCHYWDCNGARVDEGIQLASELVTKSCSCLFLSAV